MSKSCSNCKFASVYQPYYVYPYADPYCKKGRGRCSVSKVCDLWQDVSCYNLFGCGKCFYFLDGLCGKWDIHVDEMTVFNDCGHFISKDDGRSEEVKSLEIFLFEVCDLINHNRDLMEKYYEHKVTFDVGLSSLQDLKKEIQDALAEEMKRKTI